MTFSKTQKCLGVIVSVAVLGLSVAMADIRTDIQNARSGTTITCSGTYTVSGQITVASGVTVKGPATFKFTTSGSDGFRVTSAGANVTLQSLTIQGANHGIRIDGTGCRVTSCTLTANNNTGVHISGSYGKGYGNTISGCKAYNNADSSGGNADGYGCKDKCAGVNTFTSCTAYQNSDDGFDFYGQNGVLTLSGCIAYSNGKSASGKVGNGDGIKYGGQYNQAHRITSCTAYSNTAGSTKRGFDTNHNTARSTLTTCKSYSNGSADKLGNSVLSNCTMQY